MESQNPKMKMELDLEPMAAWSGYRASALFLFVFRGDDINGFYMATYSRPTS